VNDRCNSRGMDACKTLTETAVLLLILTCRLTGSSSDSIDFQVPSTDVPGKLAKHFLSSFYTCQLTVVLRVYCMPPKNVIFRATA